MVAKLVSIILAIGVAASGLLVVRQQRIDVAHEMSVIHARLIDHERTAWQMRVRIHERVGSGPVTELVHHYEIETGQTMVPLLIDDCVPATQPQRAQADSSGTSTPKKSSASKSKPARQNKRP